MQCSLSIVTSRYTQIPYSNYNCNNICVWYSMTQVNHIDFVWATLSILPERNTYTCVDNEFTTNLWLISHWYCLNMTRIMVWYKPQGKGQRFSGHDNFKSYHLFSLFSSCCQSATYKEKRRPCDSDHQSVNTESLHSSHIKRNWYSSKYASTYRSARVRGLVQLPQ